MPMLLIVDLRALVSDSNVDILFTAVFCLMYYSDSNLSDLDLQESETSPKNLHSHATSLTQYTPFGILQEKKS